MSEKPSKLPSLFGPRIDATRIKSMRVGQMKSLVDEMTREQNEYNNHMRLLIDNTNSVNKANAKLEEAIRDRKRRLNYLVKRLSKSTNKLDGLQKDKNIEMKHFKHAKKKNSNVQIVSKNPDDYQNKIKMLQEEIINLANKKEKYYNNMMENQSKLAQFINLKDLYQQLLAINKAFSEKCNNLTKVNINNKDENTKYKLKKQIAFLQKSIQRSDEIKSHLQIPKNIYVNDALKRNELLDKEIIMLNKNIEDTNEQLNGLSESIQYAQGKITNLDFDSSELFSCTESSIDNDDKNNFPISFSPKPLNSPSSQSLSHIKESNFHDLNLDYHLSDKNSETPMKRPRKTKYNSLMPQIPHTDSENCSPRKKYFSLQPQNISDNDEKSLIGNNYNQGIDIYSNDIPKLDDINNIEEKYLKSEIEKEELMSIITQLFPYQNIFPYIDISSIKVKKHRKMAPVMKRRKKIFYKENIDQDGFVFFEKSQPTYTIELRDYDNARIKKIHPYEFFCHGENNCFRDPVFEEYYDPNSGLIIKLLKHFQYINIGDKIQRIEIPIFQYIKIDENSILQKKVNFNDIVIESEDSTVHKAKIPITSEYELENILVKNGDNIDLVRHKKNMQQEEIESEGGTIRKINVEVNKPKYYYRIISNNEDSVSLEKIPIQYKTKNFDGVNVKIEVGSYFDKDNQFEIEEIESENGTIYEILNEAEQKSEIFEYSETEDEFGDRIIIKKKVLNKKGDGHPKENLENNKIYVESEDGLFKQTDLLSLDQYCDIESEDGTIHKVKTNKFPLIDNVTQFIEYNTINGPKIVEEKVSFERYNEGEDILYKRKPINKLIFIKNEENNDIECQRAEFELIANKSDDIASKTIFHEKIPEKKIKILENETDDNNDIKIVEDIIDYKLIEMESDNGSKRVIYEQEDINKKLKHVEYFEDDDGSIQIVNKEYEVGFVIRPDGTTEKVYQQKYNGNFKKFEYFYQEELSNNEVIDEDDIDSEKIIAVPIEYDVVEREFQNQKIQAKKKRKTQDKFLYRYVENENGEIVKENIEFRSIALHMNKISSCKISQGINHETIDLKIPIKRNDEFEYYEVTNNDQNHPEIIAKKIEYTIQSRNLPDGSTRLVYCRMKNQNGNIYDIDFNYNYFELDNEEIVKVPIEYENVQILCKDFVTRNVKRKTNSSPDFYRFIECSDGSIQKRKIDFNTKAIPRITNDENIINVRSPIEPVDYEDIELVMGDGTIKIVKRLIKYRKQIQTDGSKEIIWKIDKNNNEIEYIDSDGTLKKLKIDESVDQIVECISENGTKRITISSHDNQDSNSGNICFLGEDETDESNRLKNESECEDGYEYEDYIDEYGNRIHKKKKNRNKIISEYHDNYIKIELEGGTEYEVDPKSLDPNLKRNNSDDDYTFIETFDSEGKKVINKVTKECEIIEEESEGGTIHKVKKDLPMTEFVLVFDKKGNERIKKTLMKPKFMTASHSKTNTPQKIKLYVHNTDYDLDTEYDYDFVDNKSEYKIKYGEKDLESEGGTIRKVRQPQKIPQRMKSPNLTNPSDDNEEFEFLETVDGEILKCKKEYKRYNKKNKLIRKSFHDKYIFDKNIQEIELEIENDYQIIYEYKSTDSHKVTKRKIQFEYYFDDEKRKIKRLKKPISVEYYEKDDGTIQEVEFEGSFEIQDITKNEQKMKNIKKIRLLCKFSKKLHEDFDFEYIKINNEIIKRPVEYEQYKTQLQNGQQVTINKRKIPLEDFEYLEVPKVMLGNDNEDHDSQAQFIIIKRPKKYKYIEENGKLCKEFLQPEDYEYENGNRNLVKYNLIDLEIQGKEKIQVYKRVPEYEYVQINDSIIYRPIQYIFKKNNGKIERSVKVEYDTIEEISTDDSQQTALRKIPKEYKMVQMKSNTNGETITVKQFTPYNYIQKNDSHGNLITIRTDPIPKTRIKKTSKRLINRWEIDENGNLLRPVKRKRSNLPQSYSLDHILPEGPKRLLDSDPTLSISPELIRSASARRNVIHHPRSQSRRKFRNQTNESDEESQNGFGEEDLNSDQIPFFNNKNSQNEFGNHSDSNRNYRYDNQSDDEDENENNTIRNNRSKRNKFTYHEKRKNEVENEDDIENIDNEYEYEQYNMKSLHHKRKVPNDSSHDISNNNDDKMSLASTSKTNNMYDYDSCDSYDDPDDIFDMDEDGSYRRPINNKAFSKKIMQDIIQRKLDHLKLENEYINKSYQLQYLKNDNQDLSDEVEYIQFVIKHSLPPMRLDPVCQIYIHPSVKSKKVFFSIQTNTDVVSNDIGDKMSLVKKNANNEAQINEENEKIVTLNERYLVQKEKLDRIQKAGQLYDNEIEDLNKQLNQIQNTEDPILIAKRKRREKMRKMIEHRDSTKQKINEKKIQETSSIDEMKMLKNKIEDQKNLHDMIRKEIQEIKRSKRPNVQTMVSSLDFYKKSDQIHRMKLKMFKLEEEAIDKQIDKIQFDINQNQINEKEIDEMMQNIKNIKEKLKINKSGIILGYNEQSQLDLLEMKLKEIDNNLLELDQKEKLINLQIENASKTLSSKRIKIPKKFI